MLGAAGCALGPKPCEYFIARDRFNPAAFQVVITPVERFPRESEIFQKIRHHVFHELVTPTAGVAAASVRSGSAALTIACRNSGQPECLPAAHELHNLDFRPGGHRRFAPTRLFHNAPVQFHRHAGRVDLQLFE
jgi:hypothetical protein